MTMATGAACRRGRRMDPIALLLGIFFGVIGLGAWRHGRRTSEARPMVIGVALIGYSWLIEDPLISAAVGAALTLLIFWPKAG